MKHKFINKKTGAEARVMAMCLDSDGVMQVDGYEYVEDLVDDYAAYEKYEPPKEPLLKDYPEVMKATKIWAEANGLADALVFCGKYDNGFEVKGMEVCIEFDRAVCDLGDIIERGKDYGIDDLCGEMEE